MKDLKYVVGSIEANKPALIRFFGDVQSENVSRFNEEFLWLQSRSPSKIVVLINSGGGSVVEGMSTFSVINSCPIEVDCVIEGLAASMGSVIWAAGDNLYMHDYSLLMIHNPFTYGGDSENSKAIVKAFKSQLSTIYQKRFGLDEETVEKIMDGEENVDGTFLTAKDAVKGGILPAGNIIKTSKAVRDKVKNEITEETKDNIENIFSVMQNIAASLDENKLIAQIQSIPEQKEENSQNSNKIMNEEQSTLNLIFAKLGFATDVTAQSVSSRLGELLDIEQKYAKVNDDLNALNIKLSGKEAELANTKAELDSANDELAKYKAVEKANHDKAINDLIEAAIKDGKIEKDAKESWVTMAQSNLDLVKNTLESIPARVKVTNEIGGDEEGRKKAEDTLKTVEEKVKEQVEAAVGKIELMKF